MADIIPKAFDGMTLSLAAVPLKGNPGEQGKGLRGDPGDSNYQLWLKAGNTGSLEDFLLAMKGEKGEDGQGLTNRGDWEVGLYRPGDYVFADGTQTITSMWIYRGNEEFISTIPPNTDPDNWIEFAADTGKPLELRNTGEKIQWRIEGDAEWIDLIFVADLRGPAGQKGDKGDKGEAGTGLNNRGTWAAGTYQPGDYVFSAGTTATTSMWILSSTEAYVSNTAPMNDTSHWIEFAAPPGPKGDDGDDGLSVNLRKTATAIQYQQTGGAWTDLVLLSEIKGAKGDQGVKGDKGDTGAEGDVGLTGKSAYQSALDGGYSGTEAQWIASLKGAKGDTGQQGIQGVKGDKGDTGNQGIQGIQGLKGDKGDPGTTDYNNLSNKPTLGTAAAQNIGAFATAAQGTKADTAVQPAALASKQDVPSAWVTVSTFLNGWSSYDGGTAFNNVQYRRNGDLIELRGLVKNTTSAASTTIFQLPEGFRPLRRTIMLSLASALPTFTGMARVDVPATGNVTLSAIIGTDNAKTAIDFLVLDGLSFCVT